MFRPLKPSHHPAPRRGTAILITCFFLITVMMVLGLALMMYAAREKAAAIAYQDAESTTAPVTASGPPGPFGRVSVPPPENIVNQFFGSLIYDTPNDGDGLQNAVRGHSLARAMYGSQSDFSNANTWAGQPVPWAGVGTFHEDPSTYTATAAPGNTYPSLLGLPPAVRDRARIVNHTGLTVDNKFLVVDPEWTGNRPLTNTNTLTPFATFRNGPTSGNYVGKHAGYTYPDVKNFFLGARDPATGEVLVQSFHREWLFRHPTQAAGQSALHPANPNWTNQTGKLFTLRPRPAEHPEFPRVPPNADNTYTGDVQNSPGSYRYDSVTKKFISINDSLWMHIGLPTITLEGGKVVQPLVAPLILPLDGQFDLSSHGNQLGAAGAHASYGGYGPWEINLGYGLTAPGAATTSPLVLPTTPVNQENERQFLINQRNPSRNAEFDPYTSGQLMPVYGSVAWAGNQQVTFQLPSGNSIRGLPSSGDATFSIPGMPPTPQPFGNFQNDNQPVAGHPAGYNSNEFGARSDSNLSSPIFPSTDLKRLSLRYAFSPDWYLQSYAGRAGAAQTSLSGNQNIYEFMPSPSATQLPATGKKAYRLDPAHAQRLLFSTRNRGLDRIALAPNFISTDPVGMGSTRPALDIVTGAKKPSTTLLPTNVYPAPQSLGAISDFAGQKQWYNIQAALGSVNLNRPLADYRDLNAAINTPNVQPLSATNIGNEALATADRRQLAKDIFARLIVATGAAGQVSFNPATGVQILLPDPNATPQYTLTPSAGAPITYTKAQYDALRYLAQLAVNIVDYIDNDDISTVFEWNPNPAMGPPPVDYTSPTDVSNRAVFGVEKPRLVINEVYSEITNAPTDNIDGPLVLGIPQPLPASAKAHVKFWAELLNPTVTPHNPPAPMMPNPPLQGIFGTGGVDLSAYRIEIARRKRTTGNMGAPVDQLPALGDPTAPTVPPEFQSNVTGRFIDAADTKFTFSFTPPAPPQPSRVEPNGGQYTPPAATLPPNGFVLVGPEVNAKTPAASEFNPGTTGVWANRVTSPATDMNTSTQSKAMGYTFDMPNSATTLSNAEFKQHIVLLRRAANPYLKPNDPLDTTTFNPMLPTNPYVTVDMMNDVPAFDAVHRVQGQATDRKDRTMNAGGYDPVAERFSVGKVQPLAGLSVANVRAGAGNYNTYTFNSTTGPNSMVLKQTGAPSLGAGPPNPNEPLNTFGRHNGRNAAQPAGTTIIPGTPAAGMTPAVPPALTPNETIMLPFDWAPHPDRPLESLGDVFFVRDGPAHRVTSEFVVNTGTLETFTYTNGFANWQRHNDGLARALEFLAVKSPDQRVAHGGRVAGKVNANVVIDRRVAQGVWDPQKNPSNPNDPGFDINFVNNTVWDLWMRSRSPGLQSSYGPDGQTTFPVPVPNQKFNTMTNRFDPTPTIQDDASIGSDRPFQPFGAASVPPVPPMGTAGTFAYTTPQTTGDGDTILRRDPAGTTNLPMLYESGKTQPYTQSEPVRKVLNNLTTVSHTFVVYLTIGYFDVEVVNAPTGWPTGANRPPIPVQFKAEVYDSIPGDLRQRYIGIVDMSNMALQPQPAVNTDPHALGRPFFTALTTTARAPAGPGGRMTLSLASGSGDGVSTFTLPADGVSTSFKVGDPLVLGHGADTQIVTVDAVGTLPPVPQPGSNTNYPNGLTAGQVGVTPIPAATGTLRTAWGGTCVSNVRPGYAGPRTDFDLFSASTSAKYKPVVPYIERIR